MTPVSAGLSLLWTGATALIVVCVIRWRAGYVGIPGMGRQPFVVVLVVYWAFAALGALIVGLARTPAGPTLVVLSAASGILQVVRGREIAATGQPDPLGRRRNLLVAAHGVLMAGVIALMAAGQL